MIEIDCVSYFSFSLKAVIDSKKNDIEKLIGKIIQIWNRINFEK